VEERAMKMRSVFQFVSVLMFAVVGIANASLIDRGGGLIYDDVLDITWMQDAGYAQTKFAFWDDAVSWANGLEYYDPVRDVIWNDWRLPHFGGTSNMDSEMGHLYYIDGITYFTPGVFINLDSDFYWFGTPAYFGANSFEFVGGLTALDVSYVDYGLNAWAVRDGDVVPLPSTILLLSSGLISVLWLRKYRRG